MWTCAGCGKYATNVHHRRARGMGGRSGAAADKTSHPANGLAFCGSGTTGCHGWTETHPDRARLLGWMLTETQNAASEPFWTWTFGWRRWVNRTDPGPDGRLYSTWLIASAEPPSEAAAEAARQREETHP